MRACLPILSLFATAALAKRIELNWNITYTQANPDGQNLRRVIGVNGKWPLPVIEADQDDIIVLNAFNALDEPTSLHAHGFHHRGTPYYDGTIGVSECGIAPNTLFTYEFKATQTGTYWLHSHYAGQYMDGLRTPIVVHARKEPHRYDHDMPVMLEAWYHQESRDVAEHQLSPTQSLHDTLFRPYMLVNSRGGPDLRHTTLRFKPGKTYRLRLINVSSIGMMRFGIEQHIMRVIEVDGVDTEPKEMSNIQLSFGQRVSVLVTAKNSTEANYAYYADIFTDTQSGVDRAVLPFSSIVEYAPNAPLRNATSDDDSTVGWDLFDDINLVPIDRQPAPGVHRWIPLEAHTTTFDDHHNRLAFNNRTYEIPLVPTLTTALTTGYQAFYPDVYGFKTNSIIIDLMADIEVVVFNKDKSTHQVHLHGHSFFIIHRGSIDNNPANSRLAGEFPMRRDTITVPPNEFAIVRFTADNPGTWLFHSHMVSNERQGLVTTFIEAPYYIQNGTRLPQAIKDNCVRMGIPLEGNAMGRKGLDLPNEPRGPFPLAGL
ncbi:ferroxidase fet3 [Coemansia erecta]|nr:ferroxidase fet3 [Coemansia erecta]